MLYLKTDILLLADVFEKCRGLFVQVYGLEPCHYYSAPNISWDAMLKTTEVKLYLLSDIDMLSFCERAIRRGLNGIGEKRYMKAKNKYLHDFDEENSSTFGLFLDVVNLYGGTMMKKLPEDLNGQTSVWTRSCKHMTKVMLDTLYWLIWIILAAYMTITMIFLWLLRS